MDGQRPAGRSKFKVLGTEGLLIGITLASPGDLNEAVFLFDACAGLTKVPKHEPSQRVERFYS